MDSFSLERTNGTDSLLNFILAINSFYKHSLLSYVLLSGSQISPVCFNAHTFWISSSPSSSPACLFFLLVLLLFLRWLTVEEWFNQGECLFLLFLCLSVSLSIHSHTTSLYLYQNKLFITAPFTLFQLSLLHASVPLFKEMSNLCQFSQFKAPFSWHRCLCVCCYLLTRPGFYILSSCPLPI